MDIKIVRKYIKDNYNIDFKIKKVYENYLSFEKKNKCYEIHFYKSLIGKNEMLYYVWNEKGNPLVMGYQYYVDSNFYKTLDYILVEIFKFIKYGTQIDLFRKEDI